MPKIYRTMKGEQVDIEALFRKNELAVAIGNMQTNARGDELGPGGTIVKTREQKAREYYQKQKALRAQTGTPKRSAAPVEEPKQEEITPELDPLEDPEGTEGLE
jgi:hypothetical protein